MTIFYNIKKCFCCPLDTEYYCHDCDKEFCWSCKITHGMDLNTNWHYVTLYRNKFKSEFTREMCTDHPNCFYNKYCNFCSIPICDSCFEHNHQQRSSISSFFGLVSSPIICNIQTACEAKREENFKIICSIRRKTLYNRLINLKKLRVDVHSDVNICRIKIDKIQKKMENKRDRFKTIMDGILLDVKLKKRNHHFLIGEIIMIQRYIQAFEQSACRPVKFLRFVKPRSIINDLNKHFCDIQIIMKNKRYTGKESLLKQMLPPEFQKSFKIKNIKRCFHISLMTPAKVWVCDLGMDIILTDTTTGDNLYCVKKAFSDIKGLFTVNSEHELIYIDFDNNIRKLSTNMKKNIIIIKSTDSWKLECVFSSPITGNVLVGMVEKEKENIGKVIIHSQSGSIKHAIQYDIAGRLLYKRPTFIIENINGDIVVSDRNLQALVVTDKEGRYRFSYNPPNFLPCGICTDPFSNILVCDGSTKQVQIISKDGSFLSNLRTLDDRTFMPVSLSYDVNTHLLFLGSGEDNTLSVYRYMKHIHDLPGKSEYSKKVKR